MNDTKIQKIRKILLDRLHERGLCQVNGYKRFEFKRITKSSVVLLREKGTLVTIRIADIEKAIQLGSANATGVLTVWGANHGLLIKSDSPLKWGTLRIKAQSL